MIPPVRRVLLTNSTYRNTLAAVRGLAGRGFEMSVAGGSSRPLAAASRYVSRFYRYTSPRRDEARFISEFGKILEKECPDIVLPIGTDATLALAKHREHFPKQVRIPIKEFAAMETAHDKYKAIKLAEEVGVPTPPTYLANDILSGKVAPAKYPVVVKARMASGDFAYASDLKELIKKVEEMASHRNVPGVYEYDNPVVQEKIEGEVHDCCTIFSRGTMRAALTQKRLKTYPSTGGPGILNETTWEPILVEYTKKLLGKLSWHGVGLTEFIIDKRDGTPRLLEINPKFWGTTALSIAAGMNFPLMACSLALDGDIPEQWDYRVGARFRWFVPFAIDYFREGGHSLREVMEFCNIFSPKQFSDLSWRDPKPNVFQISDYLRKFREQYKAK